MTTLNTNANNESKALNINPAEKGNAMSANTEPAAQLNDKDRAEVETLRKAIESAEAEAVALRALPASDNISKAIAEAERKAKAARARIDEIENASIIPDSLPEGITAETIKAAVSMMSTRAAEQAKAATEVMTNTITIGAVIAKQVLADITARRTAYLPKDEFGNPEETDNLTGALPTLEGTEGAKKFKDLFEILEAINALPDRATFKADIQNRVANALHIKKCYAINGKFSRPESLNLKATIKSATAVLKSETNKITAVTVKKGNGKKDNTIKKDTIKKAIERLDGLEGCNDEQRNVIGAIKAAQNLPELNGRDTDALKGILTHYNDNMLRNLAMFYVPLTSFITELKARLEAEDKADEEEERKAKAAAKKAKQDQDRKQNKTFKAIKGQNANPPPAATFLPPELLKGNEHNAFSDSPAQTKDGKPAKK